MSDGSTWIRRRAVLGVEFVLVWLLMAFTLSAGAQTITNLQQLTRVLNSERRVHRDVDLWLTVCAASRPEVGVVIVQDATGVELLEIGNYGRAIEPGERIHLRGWYCLLRKSEMGVEMTIGPVVDNDGIHVHRTWGGSITMSKGRIPIELQWFNGLGALNLEVSRMTSNTPPQSIASSNLWHAVVDAAGHTNFSPGLRAECYEGYWEQMPDFNLLQPVKTGIVTNFDPGFRTRDERVGIRFTGYFNALYSGQYHFRVRSDDGSLLYLGWPEIPIVRAGFTNVPAASPGYFGKVMHSLTERRWITVLGRVSFISKNGRGLELQLHSDRDVISVRVADALGLDPSHLLNAQVKVTGVGEGVLESDQQIVLGKLFVASAKEVAIVRKAADVELSLPITSVGQARSLTVQEARRGLPVRIRGVVTDAKNSFYNRYMTIEDDTRGIFVNLGSVTNAAPACGQFWEVEGHTGAGDFAPIIVADKMTFLGDGQLPEPARPTWAELLNGSMDVQWAELKGLITEVHSNRVTLLLPEGRLNIALDGHYESDLRPFLKCVVQIRGVLYAVWNAQTHEVRVGSVMMRNAVICVDIPAPPNPFQAVSKTPRELLMFDAKATAFRRVKVRGQIVYADATQAFLEEDGMGLRLLPAEKINVRPGDIVQAVGYPNLSATALLLREALLRKTGEAALPAATKVSGSELIRKGLDSTRVRVEGRLLGWHAEQGSPVLEMQSGTHLYLARLAPGKSGRFSLRPGSRLALVGVYVATGSSPQPGARSGAFELLLNSPADIAVLSQPSWWTLRRLLILVGVLLVTLAFTAIWITQLRRLVEQRTTQLQLEIRERERVERQHALEAERSRIARDLHDDLGSSLTEISVLANTGVRRDEAVLAMPAGPRSGPAESSPLSLFHAIADKARSLIAALDVIVWAVDPEDNSLQSLADYLNGYAEEFFAHTNIACRFKVPVSFPRITIEGRVRHDLLMVVKEALNNVVRHADATEVQFRMEVSNGDLEIEVSDNGKGFETSERDRHGLKNLSSRLLGLGGRCSVESRVGGGTSVKIGLPLARQAATTDSSGPR